eukprot:379364-Ditylum_brightwellii.AAC.1
MPRSPHQGPMSAYACCNTLNSLNPLLQPGDKQDSATFCACKGALASESILLYLSTKCCFFSFQTFELEGGTHHNA